MTKEGLEALEKLKAVSDEAKAAYLAANERSRAAYAEAGAAYKAFAARADEYLHALHELFPEEFVPAPGFGR